GAAGVELGFTLRARFPAAHVSVLSDGEILPGDSPRAARRVYREAERRGIAIPPDERVFGAGPGGVHLMAEHVGADLVVWATGAAPWPWLAASPLPRDDAGF